jgi:hypothetical protein
VSLYEAAAYPCLIDMGEWQSMVECAEGQKTGARKTLASARLKTTCKRCFIDYIDECRANEQTVKQGSWAFCTCPKCLPMCDEDDNPLSVQDLTYRTRCPDYVPRHRPGYVKKPNMAYRDRPESWKQQYNEKRKKWRAAKKEKGKT